MNTIQTPARGQRAVSGRAWATAAFLLGIGVSVAANVAHTYHPSAQTLKAAGVRADQWRPELGAQAMSAFYPVALLLVVEVLSRAPWPKSLGWSAARYGGASVVAGVAAVVSYRHMAALLGAYHEDWLTCAIGPLAVDGLMVVASFALLAIGKARRTEDKPAAPDKDRTVRRTVPAWAARWTKTSQQTAPGQSAQPEETAEETVPDPSARAVETVSAHRPKTVRTRSRTGTTGRRKTGKKTVPDVDGLMPLGWRIAADLNSRGVALKRDTLAAELRAAGQPVSSEKVSALLARLKTEAPTDPTTTETDEQPGPAPATTAAKGDETR